MSSNSIPRFLTAILLLSLLSSVFGYCAEDEFKCDAFKCVNKRLQCDGKTDCKDHTDELTCDSKQVTVNSTNSTETSNSTTLPSFVPNLAKYTVPRTSTPLDSKRLNSKFKRKRVNHGNRTKGKKHHFPKKIPVYPVKKAWNVASTVTSISSTKRKDYTITSMPCTPEECFGQNACTFGGKHSAACKCDQAACKLALKAIVNSKDETDNTVKDVFEWIAISVSSAGLLLAIVLIVLKRRRLRHNNVRPLHVRTVVCYHHSHDNSQFNNASVGRHIIAYGQEGDNVECRPLCEKSGSPSVIMEEERPQTCVTLPRVGT